nr:YidC/Oxa1 family membrane protein insertase [Ardenticatena sp.]
MGSIWGAFVQLIVDALVFLHNIVGSYGLAIVLFTILIRLLTFPLTLKQLRSSRAMQELQPKIKEIQEKYKKDREKQTQEMMRLYQEAGVSPLSGCLPMLLQFPIWIGLYRAILQLADEGVLQGGWLFIPSLAEPRGLDWLTNTANWGPQTLQYLLLPVILVVTQLIVQRMMTPPSNNGASRDPNQAMMQQMMYIMPLMFGFFALQVPSGLSLYWVTSNLFQMVQQWLVNDEERLARLFGGRPTVSVASLPAGDSETVASSAVHPNGAEGVKTEEKGRSKDGATKRRKRKKR